MIIDDCESHSRCQDRKSLNSPSLDILFKMFRTKKGEYASTIWHQKFEFKTSLDLYEVQLPTLDTTSITALIKKSQCVSMVYLQVNFILWQFWKEVSFWLGDVFDTEETLLCGMWMSLWSMTFRAKSTDSPLHTPTGKSFDTALALVWSWVHAHWLQSQQHRPNPNQDQKAWQWVKLPDPRCHKFIQYSPSRGAVTQSQ